MNGPDIRFTLEKNNKRIEELLRTFVLTDEINKLLQENDNLRNHCPHEFENGNCIFCGLSEDDA